MRSVAPEIPGKRREPEELVGGEVEPDRRQLGDDHRPDLPDREGQQQRRDRDPEIAPGDGSPRWLPRTPCPPDASPAGPRRTGRRRARACGSPAFPGSCGSLSSASPTTPRSICRIATCIHSSAPGHEHEQQHEAACPEAGQVVEHAERESAGRSRRGRRSCRRGRRPSRLASGSRRGCACRRQPCRAP